ncbi:DUF4913 domain-containing protein [Pseudonocardia sp. DLS-67]
MTDDVARALTELLARVDALEAWRAHQSDLLDDLINGDTDLRHDLQPAADGATDTAPDQLDDRTLIDWVHRSVAGVIARPMRGELKWCPVWWEHPEAVFRFGALHRAWTELAAEPGVALSLWIRDHLDPCLRELLSPLGPFADCSHNERYRTLNEHAPLPTLPTTDPSP